MPNLPLKRPCVIIGSGSKAHLNLISPTISKTHAAIIQTKAGLYIRDLASRTHVLVNGNRVKEAMLHHRDLIALGAFTFQLSNRAARSLPMSGMALQAVISVEGETIPIPIDGRTMLIGRRPTSDLHLVEASVSNCHALIFEQNGARWIRDLGSRTGTIVNGKPIHQQQLELDDEIRVGETTMRYLAPEGAEEHIDELEDLVGTAKLSDDSAIRLGVEPELAHEAPIARKIEPEPLKPQTIAPQEEESDYDLAPAAPISRQTSFHRPPPVPAPQPVEVEEGAPTVEGEHADVALPETADDLAINIAPRPKLPLEVAAPSSEHLSEPVTPEVFALDTEPVGTEEKEASPLEPPPVLEVASEEPVIEETAGEPAAEAQELSVVSEAPDVYEPVEAQGVPIDQDPAIVSEASELSFEEVAAALANEEEQPPATHEPIEFAAVTNSATEEQPITEADVSDAAASEVTVASSSDIEPHPAVSDILELPGSDASELSLEEVAAALASEDEQTAAPESLAPYLSAAPAEIAGSSTEEPPIPQAEIADAIPAEHGQPPSKVSEVEVLESEASEASFEEIAAALANEDEQAAVSEAHAPHESSVPPEAAGSLIEEPPPIAGPGITDSTPADHAQGSSVASDIELPESEASELSFEEVAAALAGEDEPAVVSQTLTPHETSATPQVTSSSIEEEPVGQTNFAAPLLAEPTVTVSSASEPLNTEADLFAGEEEISVVPSPEPESVFEEADPKATFNSEPIDAAVLAPPGDISIFDDPTAPSSATETSPAVETAHQTHPPLDDLDISEENLGTETIPSDLDSEPIAEASHEVPEAAPPPIPAPLRADVETQATAIKPNFARRIPWLWRGKKTDPQALSSQDSQIQPTIDVATPALDETVHTTSSPNITSSDPAEVIETTLPTPDSAQTLASEDLLASADNPGPVDLVDSAALTDTSFARAVEELSGPDPAHLVESRQLPPAAPKRPDAYVDDYGPQIASAKSDPSLASELDADILPRPEDHGAPLATDLDLDDELDIPPAADDPDDLLSEEEARRILSAGADDEGSLPGLEIAEPSPDEPTTVVQPVSPPPAPLPQGTNQSVDSSESVQPSPVASTKVIRRFSFWPFGRKRADSSPPRTPPTLDSDGGESDANVSVSAPGSDIAITSASDVELAPPPESNVSSTTASTSPDEGDLLDVLDPVGLIMDSDEPMGLDFEPESHLLSESGNGHVDVETHDNGSPVSGVVDLFGSDESERVTRDIAAAFDSPVELQTRPGRESIIVLTPEGPIEVLSDELMDPAIPSAELLAEPLELTDAAHPLETTIAPPALLVLQAAPHIPDAIHLLPEVEEASNESLDWIEDVDPIEPADLSFDPTAATDPPLELAGEVHPIEATIAPVEPLELKSAPTAIGPVDVPFVPAAADHQPLELVDEAHPIEATIAPVEPLELKSAPTAVGPVDGPFVPAAADHPPLELVDEAHPLEVPVAPPPSVLELHTAPEAHEPIDSSHALENATHAPLELVDEVTPDHPALPAVQPLELVPPPPLVASPLPAEATDSETLEWDVIDLSEPFPPIAPTTVIEPAASAFESTEEALPFLLPDLEAEVNAEPPPRIHFSPDLANEPAAHLDSQVDASDWETLMGLDDDAPPLPHTPAPIDTAPLVLDPGDAPPLDVDEAEIAAVLIPTGSPRKAQAPPARPPIEQELPSAPVEPGALPPVAAEAPPAPAAADVAAPVFEPETTVASVVTEALPPVADIEVAPAPSDAEAPSSAPEIEVAAEPDAAEAIPSAPQVVPTHEAPPAPRAFAGMARDIGSFIGGMPLDLSAPPATSIFAATSVESLEPAATSATPAAPDIVVVTPAELPDSAAAPSDGVEESPDSAVSEMEVAETPPDLFDSTPESLDELPDAMEPIRDVVEVLGEQPHADAPPLPDASKNQPQQLFVEPSATKKSQGPAPRGPVTAMPPRPKLGGRRLAASPFDFGSQPGADVAIPPFLGGSITSGQLTTEFDGLAIPRPREADVFGRSKSGVETRVPPSDPNTRGATMLTALSGAPPEPAPPRVRLDADIPRRPSGVTAPPQDRPQVRRPNPEAAPAMQSATRQRRANPPPQFHGLPPVPPSPPLNLHLRIVLPIIFALALATAAAIWFFYHVSGSATGRLRFDNLDNLSPVEKRNFELAEQQVLSRGDVRDFARRLSETHFNTLPNQGFLAEAHVQDKKTYDNLIETSKIEPNTNDFVMTVKGIDPVGDSHRMAALVQSLYRENQHYADDAASAHQAYVQARDAADAAAAEIGRLYPVLKQEEEAAEQLDAARQGLDQGKAKSTALWQAWSDAATALHNAQAGVDRLEETGTVDAGSTGGASATPADADPQIKELTSQLNDVTQNLSQARVAHSAAADAANKALDEALGQFKSRIDQAQGSLQDGSQLKAYLVAAQQAQDTIRQLNADLVERQKAEQQRLADLSRVLSEKQEARLKAAWASDMQLQGMEQDLSVAEHRYNAAVGSGLDSDAEQLKTELDTLKKQIDARRDLIGTGDIYADEVKSLQQFIDDSIKGMESDRVRADARMGEMLKALAAAAPQIEKLPADQQALAESLEKQLDGINNARKLQAAAVAAINPEADSSVKKLEGSITELQAKLDARRKQLAEDNHRQLTTQQSEDRTAALDKAKATLAAAQLVEADASVSVRANKEQTDAAYSLVEGLRAKAANLTADTARISQLQSQLPQLKSDADRLLAAWQHIPIPQPPAQENATATLVDDPRLQWILMSSLGYALLVVGLLAVSGLSYHRHHIAGKQADDDEIDDEDDLPESDLTDLLEPRGAAPVRTGDAPAAS